MNLKIITGVVLLGMVAACSDSAREAKSAQQCPEVVYKKTWPKNSLTPQEQMLDTLAGGENPNSPTLPSQRKWDKFERDIRVSSPRAMSMDPRASLDPDLGDDSYDDQLL